VLISMIWECKPGEIRQNLRLLASGCRCAASH
jgi:hypothetical protein